MRKNFNCRLGAVLLVAVVCLASRAAQAGESEAAARYRDAVSALNDNDPERAYALFNSLSDKWPDSPVLDIGRARAAVLSGRCREAVELYRQLLQQSPDNKRLKKEAAQAARCIAYQRSGKLAPGEAPRTNVAGSVRFGVTYDSNANAGPDSDSFNFGRYIVTIPGAKKQASAAAYLGANIEVTHRLGIGNNSPWSAVLDVAVMWRANASAKLDDMNRREWQWGRVGFGFRHSTGRNLFEVKAKTDVFDYQFDDAVLSAGLEMRNLFAATKRIHLVTMAGGEWRNYQRNRGRDGLYGQFGQFFRLLDSKGRHSVTVGGKVFGGDAQTRRHQYHGWEASARLDLGVTEKLHVSPYVNFTRELYREPSTILETKRRRDKRIRVGVDMRYRLTDDWFAEANYSFVNNLSTSPINAYDQHSVGLGLLRTF